MHHIAHHVCGRVAAADGRPIALMAPLCIASSHAPHFPIRIVAVRERVEWEDKDGGKNILFMDGETLGNLHNVPVLCPVVQGYHQKAWRHYGGIMAAYPWRHYGSIKNLVPQDIVHDAGCPESLHP